MRKVTAISCWWLIRLGVIGMRQWQAGLGLVEMLLAAALGLLLVWVAAGVYGTVSHFYGAAERGLRQDRRLADFWQQLADDVRQAGTFACFYAPQDWSGQGAWSDGGLALSGGVLRLSYGVGGARWDGRRWRMSAADGSVLLEGGRWLVADCAGSLPVVVPVWHKDAQGTWSAVVALDGVNREQSLLLRGRRVVYGVGRQGRQTGLYRWQEESGARLLLPGVVAWRWQAGYPRCENGRLSGWQTLPVAGMPAAWLVFELDWLGEDGERQVSGGTVALRGGALCRM